MDEVIKFDRYVAQAKFLMEHRVDTKPQLTMLVEAIQSEINALTSHRKNYYQAEKQKENGNNPISQKLYMLRRDLKAITTINADMSLITKKLRNSPPKHKVQEKASQHHYSCHR